jgi:hypothetical protein
MKLSLRFLTLAVIIATLTTITLGVALSAGPPVVTPGADAAAVHLGAVRYRELATDNDNNVFLGVPDLADPTHNSTQTDLIWGASNTISFTYDTALDKITTTINNGSADWTSEYPNFSTNVRDLVFAGDQTAANSALSSLNYMQIDATLKEKSPAQLSLDEVYLDGNPLGDFTGDNHSTKSWQVSNYDFSAGFILTGVLNLSGISSPSGELNNVEISFGYVNVDTFAPLTSNVIASPNPVALGGNVTLTATIEDSSTGGSNIQSAEYKLGSGAWTPMNAQDGTFDSPTENVTAVFTAPSSGGGYALCTRGTDSANLTSAEECITLVVDDQGPLTSAVAVVPAVVATGVNVDLTATVDDSTTGGSVIQSAEYSLDGGVWTAMVAQDGTFDSTSEVVTASFLSPLTAGAKNVCVRGTDAFTNTGPQSCTILFVDSQGPLTSAVTVVPDKVAGGASVSLTATVDDSTTGGSNIQSAEYSIDGGVWTAMVAQDGSFDSVSEVVSGSFLSPPTSGAKNVCVRGTVIGADTGPQSCTTLTVDSQGPVTSFLVASPNPVEPGAQVTVSATVDDTTTGNTNIQSAEYQLDGGAWAPMAAQDGDFNSSSEAVTAQFAAPTQEGTVEICVRGTDALANLDSTACIQLTVSSATTPPPSLYLPIVVKSQSNP